jgi:hypothetical protein
MRIAVASAALAANASCENVGNCSSVPVRISTRQVVRRAHVRGHENVLKRLLAHASAFNLGLWMRSLFGIGTPRTLQGRAIALGTLLSTVWTLMYEAIAPRWDREASPALGWQ